MKSLCDIIALFLLKTTYLISIRPQNDPVVFLRSDIISLQMFKHKAIATLYQNILKPALFTVDAEKIHNLFTIIGETSEAFAPLIEKSFSYQNKSLRKRLLGITFENPIGLSAGFDYDGHLAEIMKHVGFGFNTVGTVTAKPYDGNKPPRLVRLPKSKSILVNKGFKSEGAEKVSQRLDKKNLKGHTVGISVGSSNIPKVNTIKKAIDDYLFTFDIFKDKNYVKYFELNISCPNTAMTEGFVTMKNFEKLLAEISKLKLKKPILIKMPSEVELSESHKLVKRALSKDIHGFIFSNLVKNRSNRYLNREEVAKVSIYKGNFSGRPASANSLNLLKETRNKFGKEVVLVGCGGVFTYQDALDKFEAGADLIQLITGMIYQGPQIAGEINYNLAKNKVR